MMQHDDLFTGIAWAEEYMQGQSSTLKKWPEHLCISLAMMDSGKVHVGSKRTRSHSLERECHRVAKRAKTSSTQETFSSPTSLKKEKPLKDIRKQLSQFTFHRQLMRAHRKSILHQFLAMFHRKMYDWVPETKRDICRFYFTGTFIMPRTKKLVESLEP